MAPDIKKLYDFITIIYVIVPNIMCAQMSLFDGNNWMNIYIEPHYQSQRFYQCMKYEHSLQCILHLQPYNEYTYKAAYVEQVNGSLAETQFNYECKCMYYKYIHWPYQIYRVECARQASNCCLFKECLGLFNIRWRTKGEYYSEPSLKPCSTDYCSVYEEQIFTTRSTSSTTSSTSTTESYVEINTTRSVSSTLNTTKYYVTTTLGQYVESTEHCVSVSINNTLNSDSGKTENTSLIIIIVFAFIGLIISTVITIFCLRKRLICKKKNNLSVIYANDSSNMNISNDTMLSAYSISTTPSSISNQNSKQIYDEFTTAIPCTDNYSTIEYTKTTNIDSNGIADVHSISEKLKGFYQNINPATDALLTKPYANLGETIRVVHHDYNCLFPRQKEHKKYEGVLLDSDIAAINVEKTETIKIKPYARLGEHIKVFEHDYNVLFKKEEDNKGDIIDAPSVLSLTGCKESTAEYHAHYSTTKDSLNPYSLAKNVN